MEVEFPNSGNRLLLLVVHSEGSGLYMLKFWFNLLCTSTAQKNGKCSTSVVLWHSYDWDYKQMRELWRHVTMVAKFLDLNNLSWHRWSFVLSNDKRKVWASVLFLTAIMHRKVIQDSFFGFFFLPYLQEDQFCFLGNLTWRRLLSISYGAVESRLAGLNVCICHILNAKKELGIGNVLKRQLQNKRGSVTSGELYR